MQFKSIKPLENSDWGVGRGGRTYFMLGPGNWKQKLPWKTSINCDGSKLVNFFANCIASVKEQLTRIQKITF